MRNCQALSGLILIIKIIYYLAGLLFLLEFGYKS